MPVFPYTRLHIGPTFSVVLSGPHIQLVTNATGNVEVSVDSQPATKGGPIRCSAVDTKWKWLVTAGEDKKLKVWDLTDRLKKLSERELPKKPTEVRITQDSETILVSDKFGDVFRYPTLPNPEELPAARPQNAGRSALASHENYAGGTLVLGHTSLLTSFLLSEDEKFIITADRDEHIRVSWYPQGYVIEQYCLGHTKFVSAIYIPAFSPNTLISGGGDSYLQLWDWTTGTKRITVPILDVVEPYIKVRPPKNRTWFTGGDGDDDDGGAGSGDEKTAGAGKKTGKGKRKRGKGKSEEPDVAEKEAKVDGGAAEDVAMEEAVAGPPKPPPAGAQSEKIEAEESPLTLVVNRIETAVLSDESKWIVFHAVGATALFYTHYPEDVASANSVAPSVLTLDLGKPILDFVPTQDGSFVVLTDGEWTTPATESGGGDVAGSSDGVRLVGWTQTESGWSLAEVSNVPPLIKALNTTCLKSATPSELKIADIYAHLSNMPKNVDPEHDPMVRDDLATLDPSTLTDDAIAAAATQLTQREVARLRNKKALIESLKKGKAGGEEEERESKKVKAAAGVEEA
ncbi:WD40-repeat-containing domain protein [Cristinia sonorae]|uniref:WD40-repeat-containing domain protein n=1 Tax=Cristinia sonorae TaxID=1940300 RepID=A0A8K0UUF5_9AGAR|nr:WD40-repeat-containing domain protein [Cristinia sonorae]